MKRLLSAFFKRQSRAQEAKWAFLSVCVQKQKSSPSPHLHFSCRERRQKRRNIKVKGLENHTSKKSKYLNFPAKNNFGIFGINN